MGSIRIGNLSLAVIVLGQLLFAYLLAASESSRPAEVTSLRIKADAFVAGSWNGIAFVVDDATGFQLRVGTRAEGSELLDGDHIGGFLTGIEDLLNGKRNPQRNSHPTSPAQNLPVFYESVSEVGPHAPDG